MQLAWPCGSYWNKCAIWQCACTRISDKCMDYFKEHVVLWLLLEITIWYVYLLVRLLLCYCKKEARSVVLISGCPVDSVY